MLLTAMLLAAPALPAQRLLARADALLAAGRVAAAESLYYDAVRLAPYDPEARLALGRYLAARGAWKVGAVLMEEARYFGGDADRVSAALVPVYARLGDYKSLAALPATPLDQAERRRVEWLRDNPPSTTGPDSVTVPVRQGERGTLGVVELRIGSQAVRAAIDPRVEGLVLDTSWARRPEVRHWDAPRGASGRGVAAVTAAVGVGELTLQNVPTRLDARRGVVVGLDILDRLAPTFDPKAGVAVLRKSGRLAARVRGEPIPTLAPPGGATSLARGGALLPLSAPDALKLLRARRWTLDARRGEIVLATK
jgi:hypothetical protein